MCAEAVQQTTFSPVFEYTKVHHIPHVTEDFVKFLKGSVEFQIHVTQHVEPPPVSSCNSLLSLLSMLSLPYSLQRCDDIDSINGC